MLAWLEEHDVIRAMLRSNLHQAQYADLAQRVLGTLLARGCLQDSHLASLWALTEEGTTFEGVRSNAYNVLANLGPYMPVRGVGCQ